MRQETMELPFLVNQNPDDKQAAAFGAINTAEDPLLFAVIGDIDKNNRYGKTALCVTATRIFALDFVTQTVNASVAFAEAETVYTKRLYGNGLVRAAMKNGETKDVFRFTFSVVDLCEAAVDFVEAIQQGTSVDEAMETVHTAYEKLNSICPRCGRTLFAPGAPCTHCMKRGRLFRQFGGYLKPESSVLIVSVILSVITTAMGLVTPLLTKQLVDDILPNKKERLLAYVGIFLIGLHIARFLLAGIRGYILRRAGDRMLARMRCDVYEKAQHLPMRFYDKTSTGAVINRINGDTATLQSFMLRVTQEVVVQFFKMVGIIVVMLVMDPKLTLLSLIPVPIIVVGARIFRKKIAPFYMRLWLRNSAVTSVLTDTIPGIRVVKSFANEKKATEHFGEKVDDWLSTDIRTGKIQNIYSAVVNALVCIGTVAIWTFGGGALIKGTAGTLTVGLLVAFINYASMFYEPVNFFANFSDTTQNAMTSTERIMDILDAEPEHDFGRGNTAADMGGRIEFKNVNFSFDRTKKVLTDINLVIEPGDIVGIVGTTGSGKSTLVNLLLRYYDHYEGLITVDGVDIRKIDMKYYRSHIGYVQQEPMMFFDTIYNNIAYGADQYSTDEVINAADVANAHEFIVRQPNGYDSIIGERGVGLSGGERQRISIARAMLRNPKMLVFDEATASVDSETEHLIQEAIEHLISGRTTIMIAHRLSTLSKANKIVVIDNGKIIECGPPEELLAQKGKYYKLVKIQSMSDKVAEERRAENL